MAYRNVAFQLAKDIFIEYIGNQAHPFMGMRRFAVERRYSCRFLAAVLEGIQTEIGKPRCFLMAVYSEQPAVFLDPSVHFYL
jgi:hypothetical protein